MITQNFPTDFSSVEEKIKYVISFLNSNLSTDELILVSNEIDKNTLNKYYKIALQTKKISATGFGEKTHILLDSFSNGFSSAHELVGFLEEVQLDILSAQQQDLPNAKISVKENFADINPFQITKKWLFYLLCLIAVFLLIQTSWYFLNLKSFIGNIFGFLLLVATIIYSGLKFIKSIKKNLHKQNTQKQ